MLKSYKWVTEKNNYIDKVEKMLEEKPYISSNIALRSRKEYVIFKQPSILLVYYAAYYYPRKAKELWPFVMNEMELLLNDIGHSVN